MQVIAVCRSRKKMRPKAAQVLDRYLFRIGDRTWRGRASSECLKRISRDLKSVASRQMAVALYKEGAANTHQRPLFFVGSRSMFSDEGACPISSRKKALHTSKTPAQRAVLSLVEIGALFHDVGKASLLFQRKITAAAEGSGAQRDAVRHELLSALMFAYLVPPECDTAAAMARRLLDVLEQPDAFEAAWKQAADRCQTLHRSKQSDISIFPAGLLGDLVSTRAQTIMLILGHHRLPNAYHQSGRILAEQHVDRSQALGADDLEIAPGTPFWKSEWFEHRLATSCRRLCEAEDFVPLGLDVLARLPLMLADHIGSARRSTDTSSEHLANTGKQGGRGDSLLKHVMRVTQSSRAMTFGALQNIDEMPSVLPDVIPPGIASPAFSGNRFDWQPRVALAVQDLVATAPGGFFAVLTAGTGAGKTRGAAVLMAAASIADSVEAKRKLRFNLALPLRTLARQSGIEYTEDLGFPADDVATLVGGYRAQWIADRTTGADNPEQSGSEDRLTDLNHIQVEDVSDLGVDLSCLSADADRRLPSFAEQVCEAANDENKARGFLSKPIIAATIDHLMPATDPVRGSHLLQTLRVMSADLIIDELDLLGEEDLSAVKRLVRIVGLAGRRVLLMSATMPRDVVNSLYAVYRDAYATHARLRGTPDNVNFLCASDVDGAIATSLTHRDIASAFEYCQTATHAALELSNDIHHARILERAENWSQQIELISQSCDNLHRDNHFEQDGMRISAGLIRMTRVKHLQALASEIGDVPSEARRVFCVLHSRMPRAQREYIERKLKKALTRKGEAPDERLIQLLVEKGHIEGARAAGQRDIQVIVLASPVIETGNDVDFDWLVADPSSARSLVQAAGRVNRHRRFAVKQPNIAVLGDYCVVRTENEMKYPGPETKPVDETGVTKIKIGKDTDRSAAALLEKTGVFPLDARLTLPENTPLAGYEESIRNAFDEESTADFGAAAFWWTRSVGKKHQFRRRHGIQVDLYPRPRQDGHLDWIFWPSSRSREHEDAHVKLLRQTQFTGEILFPETLTEILEKLEGHQVDRVQKASPLTISIHDPSEIAQRQYLDPVLGLLGEKEEITAPTFSTLP